MVAHKALMNCRLLSDGILGLPPVGNVGYLRPKQGWQGVGLLWWAPDLGCWLVGHVGADQGLAILWNVLVYLSVGGTVLANTMLLVLVRYFDPDCFEDWVEGG